MKRTSSLLLAAVLMPLVSVAQAVPAPAPTPVPAAPAEAPPAPPSNRIQAEIQHLRSDQGRVFCLLFNTPASFPTRAHEAVGRTTSRIQGGRATCVFDAVVPGTYAISVHHDENGNGRLDTGLFGIPSEPVAASNNARGSFGPPRFADARFVFAGDTLTIRINM